MVESSNQNTRTGTPVETLRETIRAALDDGVTLVEFEELVSTVVAERKPDDVQDDILIYDELPPGLLTVNEAARKYERSPETIRTWIRSGYLASQARLRASARGGGLLLVSEAELIARLTKPPKMGRPKKN